MFWLFGESMHWIVELCDSRSMLLSRYFTILLSRPALDIPPTLSLPFLLSFLPADVLTDLKKEDSFSNWSIFELRLEQIGYDESQWNVDTVISPHKTTPANMGLTRPRISKEPRLILFSLFHFIFNLYTHKSLLSCSAPLSTQQTAQSASKHYYPHTKTGKNAKSDLQGFIWPSKEVAVLEFFFEITAGHQHSLQKHSSVILSWPTGYAILHHCMRH